MAITVESAKKYKSHKKRECFNLIKSNNANNGLPLFVQRLQHFQQLCTAPPSGYLPLSSVALLDSVLNEETKSVPEISQTTSITAALQNSHASQVLDKGTGVQSAKIILF
ncbi:MAG: hypothetical protein K0R73_1313 [Candidatus Midichloriaceae bacterium]|nr:hypothetical protein [Candidatus Midichloriaceae bacterium]